VGGLTQGEFFLMASTDPITPQMPLLTPRFVAAAHVQCCAYPLDAGTVQVENNAILLAMSECTLTLLLKILTKGRLPLADMQMDIYEMRREGYSESEIAHYLQRSYLRLIL
jgi:hypothetical protein